MIPLARHIELLLLEHDCVIVPGFGGFIANYNQAVYNAAGDSMYLPPFRTVAFNQQLTLNDGLLVQSYMTAYDASYPAACLQMEQDVDRMSEQLDNTGEYKLEGVGVLRKLINSAISFTSFESGVTTPSLYGLYSFEMHSLEQMKKEREQQEALRVAEMTTVTVDEPNAETGTNNSEPERRFRISRRWRDIAVSAAAAAVLFFAFIIPATHVDSTAEEVVVASAKSPITTGNTESATKHRKADKVAKPAATAKAKKPANEVSEQKAAETKADEQAYKFTLVLASYVTEPNANGYIDKLRSNGFTEGRFVKKGKVSRVLYSGYATEAEAYAALRELRKQSAEFAEAWVMEVK